MKKLSSTIYLIEGPGQFDDAIRDYLGDKSNDYTTHPYTMPTDYPYVLVLDDDDERVALECRYVTLVDFENRGEDAKPHLFEFRIRRVYLTTPYRVRESDYQIPARDIFEAMVQLGQTHHRDEEYDLTVLSWRQVK